MLKKLCFVLAVICFASACKKETEPEDLTYKCECGEITWNDESFDLTDAHWITTAVAVNDLGIEFVNGKDYYTTAKVVIEDEVEPHHLNMKLSIPDISAGIQVSFDGSIFFAYEEAVFSAELEEVNFNSLSTIDTYSIVAGAAELTQSLDGSVPDVITFELEIVQTLNGIPAGLPFLYSGTVMASKEEL